VLGETAEGEHPALDSKLVLERIEAISRDARTTWFLLLTYSVFVGVTLLGVRDLDFFSIESRTTLPVLNIAIPTATFFWAAPWLGAVLHIYFHIYLLKLWDAIAAAPRSIDGVKLGDRIFVWLVNDWALRQRSDRPTTPRPMDRLGDLVSAIVVWLMVPLVITWTWWRSMTAHDAWLTLAIGGALVVSLYASLKGWRRAHERLREANANPRSPSAIEPLPTRWRKSVVAFGIAVAVVSLLRTQVGDIRVGPFESKGLWLAPIDVVDAEVVLKPDDWVGRDTAERRFRITWCRDRQIPADACERPTEPYQTTARENWCYARGIEDCSAEFRRLENAFAREWQEQRGEYLANLIKPDLSGRDLRGANAAGVFLSGVDLRGARLKAAYLWGAQLEGAYLSEARLEGANLSWARLEGAYLFQARLQSAEWVFATIGPSPAHSADFTDGKNLTQSQLAQVIGDGDTILPLDAQTGEQLYVWTCWPEPPPTLDGLLRQWPAVMHAILRAHWLCPPGVAPERTGRPAAPVADPTGAD
jgi:hypothetical protein